MKYVRWIWHFWQPHRLWLIVLIFMTLLSSAVAVAFPQVLRYLFDTLDSALAQGDRGLAGDTTRRMIWALLGIGVVRSISRLYPGFRAIVNARIEKDVREHYFSLIVDKGHRFFQKFRSGDLITRLTDDIGGFPKIAWFACSGIFRAVESASMFLFCVIVMFAMSWQLTLLTLLPLPLMLYIFYRIRVELTRRSADRQRIISETNDTLEAAFSGVRILKAFGGEADQAKSFAATLDERIEIELGVMKMWMGVHQLYWGIQFVGQIIVIIAGGLMVLDGTLTLGEFVAFYMYMGILMMPLMDIPQLFVTSRQAFASIDREIEIEETSGGTEGFYTGTAPIERLDEIELKNLSFSYEEGAVPSLVDVNLRLRRGERAAVVGTVGSGKSTLIKALAGILPPSAGRVLVNGAPLTELDIRAYRSLLGYVPQEATLFSESVLENVKFGRAISDEQAIEALSLAQLKAEMAALPDGFAHVLGQKGLTISGGQKQRLAIARALAARPQLLLMDDCTSALDAQNERRFWEQFGEWNPAAMVLIVTHRLSTAREADLIYVMDAGRIVGAGPHLELLTSCEQYRNLLTQEELEAALL